MSETELSKAIRIAIKRHFPQIRFTRLHCGRVLPKKGGVIHLADPGWPDYIGYLPDGRFLGIEIKDPDGKTAKDREQLQTERREDANSCNAVCLKVEGVLDCIKQLKEKGL